MGDICFGVSSRWWKEEHDEHHAITNTYDTDLKTITDKQACEDFWCQNEKVTAFFRAFYHPFIIRFQHYLTLPLCVLFGRVGIMIDCWIWEIVAKKWINVFGLVIHWAWVIYLSKCHDNWLGYYLIMSFYQGSLATQLQSNHITKPFVDIKDIKYHSYAKRMVEVNVNFKCSRWMDWWYGGLHFHNEHHVFPKMPRYNLRLISYDMKKLMKECDVEYHYDYLTNIWCNLFHHLKRVGKIWIEETNKEKMI